MIIRTTSKFITLAFVSSAAFAASSPPDQCETLLPTSLKDELPIPYPGFRLAHVSDYGKENIDQHEKEHNGNPCFAIASTDVDNDNFKDFAFLITNKSRSTLLIGARNTADKSWKISTLYDFGNDGPGRAYVDVADPGQYQDLFDSDRAPSDYVQEPGRVRKFRATHSGFIAGDIESTGVAFFFTGKRWVHLWLSD